MREQDANSLFLRVSGLCANLLEVSEGLLRLQWALNLTPYAQLIYSLHSSFASWLVNMKRY